MRPKARRWQLYHDDGVPIEVSTDGSRWMVTAAGTVRTTNHDLRAALRELVGHLVDTEWLNATSRLLETAMHIDQPTTTGVDRAETDDHPRQAGQRRSPRQRPTPG